MKYTKTLVAATLLATCVLSQPVLAKNVESAATSSTTAAALANSDISFAFGQTTQPVQVAMLSEKEMKETEGALLPLVLSALGGAAVGGGTYLGSTLYRSWDSSSLVSTGRNFVKNFSPNDLAWAAGGGAVGGTYSGALFRGVGYSGLGSQITAPAVVQIPIRGGGAGLGFSTFGVHGYPTTNFNSGGSSGFSPNCGCFSGW